MEEIDKLKKENEELKKVIDNKSGIISITAHQLRTSLSALKWILKMLIDGDAGNLNDEQKELMGKAFSSNERVLTIVNDLLTLSHTDDSSTPYHFEQMDMLQLMDQIIFEFKEETKKKSIELILLKPQNPIPLINCDKEMIRVAIQNLVENAIKYSNAGGKVIAIIEQKENNIEISVHDGGIGISEEDKDNIFKKFFRAPNAIKKDVIGSGLGLFATKNIVERHKGKIWFLNTEGGGTTFFISLPII